MDDTTDLGAVVRQVPAATEEALAALARFRRATFGSDRTLLGRYRLVRRVGAGGMGVVFEAVDERLQRDVAIKFLRTGPAEVGRFVRRLRREAQALAAVSDPRIVEVFDFGILAEEERDLVPLDGVEAGAYIVMELVRSADLRVRFEAGTPPAQVLELLAEAGRGLASAHAAGVVHGDFKPANVLVTDDAEVRIVDFGVARGTVLSDEATAMAKASAISDFAESQATDAVFGTPAYMAPEQHAGDPVGFAADQYALCVAAFEGLYGRRPFQATTLGELVVAKQRFDIDWRSGSPGVSRAVQQALRRGLQPAPDERFPSMAALVAALETRPRVRWPGALRTTAWLLVLAAVAVVVTWVGLRERGSTRAVETTPSIPSALIDRWAAAPRSVVVDGVAAARARFLVGDRRGAFEALDRLRTLAERHQHEPSLGRIDAVEALLRDGEGSCVETIDRLRHAYHRADAAGLVAAAAQLATRLAMHNLGCRDDPEAAASWVRLARTHVVRGNLAPALVASVEWQATQVEIDSPKERLARFEALRRELQAASNDDEVWILLTRTISRHRSTLGQGEVARQEAEHALARAQVAFGGRSPVTADAFESRGIAEFLSGDPTAALDSLGRAAAIADGALGSVHLDTLRIRLNIASALIETGSRLSEGVTVLRALLEPLRQVYGPEHSTVVSASANTALCELVLGEKRGDVAMLRAAEARIRRAMVDDEMSERFRERRLGTRQHVLGVILRAQGRYPEARTELRSAVVRLAQSAEDRSEHEQARFQLATTALVAGDHDEAIEGYLALIADTETSAVVNLESRWQLVMAYIDARRTEDAATLLASLADNPKRHDDGQAWILRGRLATVTGDHERAILAFARAEAKLAEAVGGEAWRVSLSEYLGDALAASGDRARAVAEYLRALDLCAATQAEGAQTCLDIAARHGMAPSAPRRADHASVGTSPTAGAKPPP